MPVVDETHVGVIQRIVDVVEVITDAIQAHHQRIARFGPFDKERASLRVAARRGLAIARVFAHRIDGGGHK